MESQHSQVSLFSGSEAGSSLELFSQPPPQDNAITASATNLQLPMTGGRKYYMKYLSLQSSAMESSSATVTGLSVPSNNVDAVTSKMNFETWKDRQQNQLERKQVLKDMAEVANEIAIKVNGNIGALREELKTSIDRHKMHTEENSSQGEKQTLDVLTQLLCDQEKSRQMMQEMQEQLTQHKRMLMVLSSKLSNDTSSELADRIIEGVRNAIQQAAVSVTSVGTQTFSPPATRSQQSFVSDQSVPAEPTLPDCTERCLQEDACKPPTESEGLSIKSAASTVVCNPCTNNMGHEVQAKVVTQVEYLDTNYKITAGGNTNVCGKRRNVESPPVVQKVPHTSNKAKKRVKPATCRRSSRATKRPVKYTADYCSSMNTPMVEKETCSFQNGLELGGIDQIKRKVSLKQTDRGSSHENYIKESPANALSDSLYSQASTENKKIAQPLPPVTTHRDQKGNFHRRNEAAKRRKMVISSLSDPDLLLRELKDCILNCVNTSDPSP